MSTSYLRLSVVMLSCLFFGLGFLSSGLHAQVSIGFNADSTEFGSNFTEQGQSSGTTFSYASTGGINNTGRIAVSGSIEALRRNIPLSGFAAPGTGYTIAVFFKARSTTGGTSANLSIATGLFPTSTTSLGVNSGANVYLTAQIAALATATGTSTQFQISFRSRDGSTQSVSPDTRCFTLTEGNWYKLSTTYQITAARQFAAIVSVDNFGSSGMDTPNQVIAYTSSSLSNSALVGAAELWAALKTGAPTGAGCYGLDQFTIGLSPDPSVATRPFPADSGIINVKLAPYNAVGDGLTDDTVAIQKAISQNTGIIYFPSGTYKVSNSLVFKNVSGQWACFRTLQGESRNGAIIKLVDNCTGFTSSTTPKAVIYTASQNPWDTSIGSGDQAFMNSICNLTVDVGSGNAGAVGIDYVASNQGTVRDVLVKSSDPLMAGKYGIYAMRPACGPCLIQNVEIRGFETGLRSGGCLLVMTAENLTISGQLSSGILNSDMTLTLRRVTSTNSVPAIMDSTTSSYGYASFIVLDEAELLGGSASNYAINVGGNVLLRDIHTSGYKVAALRSKGTDIAGPHYREYASPASQCLSSTTLSSLRLPVEETPVSWDTIMGNWVSAGTPNGTDDTATIQSAIDNAPIGSTLYFPHGTYKVSSTITLRNNIRQVVGMMSQFQVASVHTFTNSAVPKPVFRIETPASTLSATLIENLWVRMSGVVGAVAFEDASTKPVVIRNVMIYCGGGALRNTAGSGKLFLEDFGAHGQNGERVTFHYPQKIWARQLDVECGVGPMITNSGATLWVLGYKTERTGPYLVASNGSQSEIFGAYHLVNDRTISSTLAAYQSVDSDMTLSFATGGNDPSVTGGDYSVYVRRMTNGVTLELLRPQTYGRYGSSSNYQRVMPLLNSD